MRRLLPVAVGYGAGQLVWLGLWMATGLIGGDDCERRSCNFVGEAAAGATGELVFGVTFAAFAVAVSVAVWRGFR